MSRPNPVRQRLITSSLPPDVTKDMAHAGYSGKSPVTRTGPGSLAVMYDETARLMTVGGGTDGC
jgi:predicted glycosyltransferase